MSQDGSKSLDPPEVHALLGALCNMGLGRDAVALETSPETSAQPISGFNMTLKDLLVLLEAIGVNVPLVPCMAKDHKLDIEQEKLPSPSVRPGANMDHRRAAHSSGSSTNGEDMVSDTFGTSSSFSESENFDLADIDEYDPGKTIRGFVCAQCKAYNLVRPAKESCYVVTAGLEVGVFTDWLLVKPLVVGVSKACYKRYGSMEEAQEAFDLAQSRGDVKVLPGI